MLERLEISGNSAAASATGFASNVTGASFTLSTTETSDGLAHLVTITNDSATDHSGKTVALVGTDAQGNVLTETVTGPGVSATVTSTSHFKTLTSATPSATIGADTFDIGWAAESVSAWKRIDHRNGAGFSIGFACEVDSGSPTYTVQHTYGTATAFDHASVANETTTQDGSYTAPVKAVRLKWAAAGQVSATFYVAA